MPKPIQKNHRYIGGLDGLRAIAVLSVILYHLHVGGIAGGYLGVTIFFVLSGYLITDLLINEWNTTGRIDFKKFFIRRFRRLIPALFAMLLLVGFWITLFQRSFLIGLREEILSAVFYVSNWFYVAQHHSYFTKFAPPSPLQHMWSLAVEEQFYIIWPLVMLVVLRFVKMSGKVAIGICSLAFISAIAMFWMYTPGEDPSRVYYGTDTRAFSLLIGAALAFVWPSRKLKANITDEAKKLLNGAGIISALVLLLMIIFMHEEGPFLYEGGMLLASLATAVLIAVIVHPASSMGEILSFRPLLWVGVRSYGIYIWHFPFIVLMGAGLEGVPIPFWKTLIIVLMTVLFAELSWRFVEDPIRKGEWKVWVSKFKTHEWSWKWKDWTLPYRIGSAMLGCIVIIFMMGMISTPTDTQASSRALEQHLLNEEKKLENSSATTVPKKEKQDPAKKEVTSQKENSKDNSTREEAKLAQKEKEAQLAKKKEQAQKKANEKKKKKKIVPGTVPSSLSVTAIGDSVMLSAASALKAQIPQIVVDAKVGRQMYDTYDVVTSLKSQGKLGKVVVVGLGSNGDFSGPQLEELLNTIGKSRHIYLINTRVTRNWQDNVNRKLNEAIKKRNNVRLINWYEATEDEEQLFYNDHIHPNAEGAKYYTALISSEIAKHQ